MKKIQKEKTKQQTTGKKTEKKQKKSTLHPNYRVIDIIATDGEKYQIRSTYKNDTLKLEVDSKTHSAWTGKRGSGDAKIGEVEKFRKSFGTTSFFNEDIIKNVKKT